MTLENVAITSFWVDVDLRVDVAGELSGDDVDVDDDDKKICQPQNLNRFWFDFWRLLKTQITETKTHPIVRYFKSSATEGSIFQNVNKV